MIAPAAALLALLALAALPAPAQDSPPGLSTAPPQRVRVVEGNVVRPVDPLMRPVPGIWVTLHRVAADSAGPLDSVRSDAEGRYAFRYRPWGDEGALYFVSASYGGIAYFAPPLRTARVTGEDAEIVVFDTTSRHVPIAVRGRHIVVSAPGAGGTRSVVEVFELSNDSSVTRVATDTQPTWLTHVPVTASDFIVGQGDIAPDAVTMRGGRVALFAPLAPGLKQLSFQYRLPADAFPLAVPTATPIDVLEVLIEEPTGEASGAGLGEQAPVSVEGRTFRRFLAQDAPASAVIRIAMPSISVAVRRSRWLKAVALAVGSAMLVALPVALRRRGRARAGHANRTLETVETADALADRIADLDAAFERVESPDDSARAVYALQRAELKSRLERALAPPDRAE